MTVSIKGLFVTLSIHDTQHYNALLLCQVSRFISCYAECHFAECHYAECCGAKFKGLSPTAAATERKLQEDKNSYF